MDEEVVKRILPYNIEAEQSVIGAMIVKPKYIPMISEIIPGGHCFYNRAYGAIYDGLLKLDKENIGIDIVTLPDRLLEKGGIEKEISQVLIKEAVVMLQTAESGKEYARLVSDKYILRELIKASEEITNTCYQGKESVSNILDDAEKKIFQIVQNRNLEDITPIDTVVMDALESIEKAASTTGDVTGLATGFLDLDRLTAGFQEGNLVLVAARPAMGKTSFVLSMAKYIAVNQNKPIALFSLEMSKRELVNRLLSMDSKVDSQKFKTGNLSGDDWVSLVESGGDIGGSPLYLDDMSTTVNDIRAKCRKLKMEHDIQLVIIDYLQLMNSTGRTDSRQQEIAEISRALKLMAKELQVPVVALSQLSRQVEGRTDHRPMLSDLRESGAIEQDADVVLFIYRDEVYNKDTERKNVAEIIIAKQRSGPIGTVELAWLPEYTQFGNLAK